MGLPIKPEKKILSLEWNNDSPVEKIFRVQRSVKKGMLSVLGHVTKVYTHIYSATMYLNKYVHTHTQIHT